ncbi:MAG: type II toxin-antitoxin system VapC family toxin [Clostridiales Family XIII bacterium]|nr:type II toxin-antitoxin system VapC family toxin [Clostridiales Family XIII bacterium]
MGNGLDGEVGGFLLDTHAFLWAAYESGIVKLGARARAVIEDPDALLYLSSISVYEIANKHRLGKIPEYASIAENLIATIKQLGAEELPVNFGHAYAAANFDWGNRDPFDRMIAAQACAEGLVLISADAAFAGLRRVEVLW